MPNLQGFDANQVESARVFEPIPPGKYPAVITALELKGTRAGTGSYLELTFTVTEGIHKNRRLRARFNLDNPSRVATKIARAKLAAVCRAVGVPTPNDSAELHNLPLTIEVRKVKHKHTGQINNELVGFEKPSRN